MQSSPSTSLEAAGKFRSRLSTLLGAALVAASGLTFVHAATYEVHLQPQKFTLYTDPYNGKEIKVGGFSGLYPAPGKHDEFYVITDRGPSSDYVDAANKAYKTWLVPGFGPNIISLRLSPSGKAFIETITPLTRPDGALITGLPTTKPATDIPYDVNLNVLPFDEDSLDAEGLTIDPWGNFWVCEEYKPSVAMIAPNGRVQMRLVPAGTLTGLEQVPTYDVLPAVLAKRRSNRGLEGLAAAADGILYAIMQRPLSNPNRAAGDANGNARLVAINLRTLLQGSPEPLVRQYLYRIPTVPNNVTLSDLFSTGPGRLLVPERATDKLFEIDVTGATDLTPLENATTGKLLSTPTKTLEQLNTAGLAALGVVSVSKRVVLDSMMAIDPLLEKVEGVCVVGNNLVFTYDNDFNVADLLSTPANPNPDGPLVQLELLGANYPKIFVVPMPQP